MSLAQIVSSKNLNGACELTLIADIKSGFVPFPDPMSYGTRLKELLSTLFDSRKDDVEQGIAFLGPLERLRTIHFVRWCVLDDDRRLLLAVSFDRPWEPYIRHIVDEAGPLLDVIFSHCEGYEGHTCRDGYSPFAEWVRARQKECEFFFSAFPGQTVDDITYLRTLQQNLESLVASGSAPVPAGAPPASMATLVLDAQVTTLNPAPPGLAEYGDFFRSAVGLYRLRAFFPDNIVTDAAYTDRAFYDRAVRIILGAFGSPLPNFPQALAAQYSGFEPWYEGFRLPLPDFQSPPSRTFEGVQGGILEAYLDNNQAMTHGCAVLIQFRSSSMQSAINLLKVMTSKCVNAKVGDTRYNIGFTKQGLKKLGQSERSLANFPAEFIQGMAERASLLGDIDSNHPDTWRLPKINWDIETKFEVPLSSVDAVIILQRRCEPKPDDHLWSAAHPLADEVFSLQTYGVTLLHVQALRRYDDTLGEKGGKFREHFGFLDGFSQPEVADAAPLVDGENQVARGEILLGHPNDSGEIPGDGQPLLTNGSFLVLRKLSQDVASFRSVVGNATCPMAAKMVGRTSEGAPLVNTELKPPDSWFNFKGDEAGLKCPLQSHARLANPRGPEGRSAFGRRARTPRIMRRGFSYGPRYDGQESAERGLLFMAYNASIAQQYEVIQRWLNGANSTGLDSSQRDPLSGAVDTPASGTNGGKLFRYREGDTVTAVALPPTPFARLEWGMYLFVPSQGGLGVLAEQLQHQLEIEKAQSGGNSAALTLDEQAGLSVGQELLARLLASDQINDWKMLLEEQGAGQSEQSFKVLAAIRANHRVLRTPVGVLVVGAAEALEVLTQEERFSVREYWRRMRESTMEMYLGMDARPVPKAVCPMSGASGRRRDQDYVDSIGTSVNYQRESIANGYIDRISRLDGFLAAFEATSQALDASIQVERATLNSILALLSPQQRLAAVAQAAAVPLKVAVDLSLLAQQVISGLSALWFALPDGAGMRKSGSPNGPNDPVAYCPLDFGVFSEYVFRPAPDEMTEGLSAMRGARVTQVTADFVAATYAREGKAFSHEFLKYLQGAASRSGLSVLEQQGLIVRSVVGTVDGFVAATYGSFLSVMSQWLADGETLWRVQTDYEKMFTRAQLEALKVARTEQPAAAGPVSEPPEAIANSAPFVREVTNTLKNFPKPAWLHRVAMKDTDLGNVQIKAGERVVVHLGQAALEQPGSPELLFGGPYRPSAKGLTSADRTPLHACPAREMALGVLLGMFVAVLKRKNLRLQTTLAITFDDFKPSAPAASSSAPA